MLIFYCPVNRAQARAVFMGLVLGGEERHKGGTFLMKGIRKGDFSVKMVY